MPKCFIIPTLTSLSIRALTVGTVSNNSSAISE